MKILSVVGARPQFIKEFPINRQLKNFPEIKEVLVHTGQHYHYEMSKIFFEELELPEPDYHLGVGSGKQGEQTAKIIIKLEEVLIKERPDIVFVYGDTNSTLAGALAAVKLKIPVAHIEAGLRSFRMDMPEEVNRVLTDHISTFLFCPTKTALENLKKEGIFGNSRKKILDINKKYAYLVGDVMEEALSLIMPKIERNKEFLKELDLKEKRYLLITIHRAENTDNKERLEKILEILKNLSESYNIIFPIHPRTKKQVKLFNLRFPEKVKVVKPLSYIKMLTLEKYAYAILTDSGGVQKEAYWLSVPCFTLRKETEWIETIKEGLNFVTDLDLKKIKLFLKHFIPNKEKPRYNNLKVSKNIIEKIKNFT